jgi:hypothetical protein
VEVVPVGRREPVDWKAIGTPLLLSPIILGAIVLYIWVFLYFFSGF